MRWRLRQTHRVERINQGKDYKVTDRRRDVCPIVTANGAMSFTFADKRCGSCRLAFRTAQLRKASCIRDRYMNDAYLRCLGVRFISIVEGSGLVSLSPWRWRWLILNINLI